MMANHYCIAIYYKNKGALQNNQRPYKNNCVALSYRWRVLYGKSRGAAPNFKRYEEMI